MAVCRTVACVSRPGNIASTDCEDVVTRRHCIPHLFVRGVVSESLCPCCCGAVRPYLRHGRRCARRGRPGRERRGPRHPGHDDRHRHARQQSHAVRHAGSGGRVLAGRDPGDRIVRPQRCAGAAGAVVRGATHADERRPGVRAAGHAAWPLAGPDPGAGQRPTLPPLCAARCTRCAGPGPGPDSGACDPAHRSAARRCVGAVRLGCHRRRDQHHPG